jgi:glycosyl hydrolase family 123
MMARRAVRSVLVVGLLMAAIATVGAAPLEPSPVRTVVLDTTGFWRFYHTFRPPVIQLDTGLKTVEINTWLDFATAEPALGWQAADFDDSTWLRGPARIVCRTPYTSHIAIRGTFGVTDPARVTDLRLTVAYYGGAVVTVNGTEVARQHVPEGPLGAESLAEAYPREAFVNERGKLLVTWDLYKRKLSAEDARRVALRDRRLTDIVIPKHLLRKGRNVVAIELLRAPYNKATEEMKDAKPGRKGSAYNLAFNTCELRHVQLTASSAKGLVPGAVRPKSLQVWNNDPLAADFDLDFASPAEPLYPVKIVGCRGGIFSGKLVVGSSTAIENLKVTIGDLVAPDGSRIKAAQVRLRYGIPWGGEWGVWGRSYTYWDCEYTRYPRRPTLLGALDESPLAIYPVRTKKPRSDSDLRTPGQPEPVFGAVVPVWITVDVPRDAESGDYRATVTIRAKNHDPIVAKVHLHVADWTLPERGRYRGWAELIQVPDTTAVEYKVPMYSQKHWTMIARAMKLIGETGSRVLYVPLICNTNLGHSQSMVRWVARGDGTYDYDFTVLDRYLDTAMKHMGKPKLIVVYAWDIYSIQPDKLRRSSSHDQEKRALRYLKGNKASLGSGPVVSVLDRATGQTSPLGLPAYDEPESTALWKPLYDALRERLGKRGLSESLMLGCMSDAWPRPAEARVLKELSGDLPWVSHSHMGAMTWRLHDVANVGYQSTVTQNGYANDVPGPMGSHAGWNREKLFAEYARGGVFNECPATRLRQAIEFNVTGRQRGLGRIGADFWPAIKNKYGERVGNVAARYPQSGWRNLNLYSSLLGPGTDGPVATWRFEAFREGCQETEARIVIEQALLDKALRARLGEPLARRCEALLRRRTIMMLKSLPNHRLTGPDHWYVTTGYTYWHRMANPVGHHWFIGSGYQERSRRLFAAAGEVARALEGRVP